MNQIKPIFDAGGIELNIIETRYAGHAKDIARSAVIEDYESIAIVGGDGSMHEVINGLFLRSDNRKLPIGLIPAGTGNSLMHDFKCLDPSEATRNIVKGYTRKLDIAKVNMEHKTVYAFNMPTCSQMVEIENDLSGFEKQQFIDTFENAGARHRNVNPPA